MHSSKPEALPLGDQDQRDAAEHHDLRLKSGAHEGAERVDELLGVEYGGIDCD